MRFFRCNDDAAYEHVRTQLNEAWGLPNGSGTDTCLPTLGTATRDNSGQIVLPLKDIFCGWEPAASMMPQLLAGAVIEEISQEQYQTAMARDVP